MAALLVARCVGATIAGSFFIGLTIATIVAVLCRAGFDQALTRCVATDLALGRAERARETCRDLIGVFTRRMVWVCPLLMVAIVAAISLPIPGLDTGRVQAMAPFVLAAPFLGIAALTGAALQAAGRPLSSVCSLFFLHNGFVIAAALLPSAQREAGAFNLAFLLGSACAATFGLLALRAALQARVDAAPPGLATGPVTIDRTIEARALARENAGTVVGNLMLVWGPMSLLGLLSSPVEAARFGVASRCAQIVSFALPALNFVLAPRFAALRAMRENAKLRRLFLDSLMLSLALSSVAGLPMIVFADPIMGVFGAEYAGSVAVLVLLALSQWANGASGAAIQFLAMTGGEKPLRHIFVVTASIALLAGIVLIRRDGAMGAATLALGSFLMMNVLCTSAAVRQMRRVTRERADKRADTISTGASIL
jgi:O-antigen/teichoic acid export membrane protein